MGKPLALVMVFLMSGTGLFMLLAPLASAEAWVKTDMGAPTTSSSYRFFGVDVGDGDRDGAVEVYFTARQTGGVYQYSYDAVAGNWTAENAAGQNFNADTVVLGDGDDSGDRELYVIGVSRGIPKPSNGVFQIYHDNTGWHQNNVALVSAEGRELALGDGNNDNRTELYGACGDGHIYMYYKMGSWNSQDIGYASPPSGQSSTSMEGLAVGDGDNDGHSEVYGSAATGWVYRFGYSAQTASWSRTDVGKGETSKAGSNMASIAIGDLNWDGKNEVYGASWNNASIYMFKYVTSTSSWERSTLVSLGTQVNAFGLAIGDGNSDGADELYVGTSNNQVYMVRNDRDTGYWVTSSIGSGNGPMNGVSVGSAAGDPSQKEVYAACQDGHGYQFLVDRTPPANPSVWSDTHPVPGTWYANSVVHVLWKDVGKDPSGMDGYSLAWDNSPSTIPDAFKDVEETVHDANSPALSPGKWYFHIRARDNALNWNDTAEHFGPICIGTAPDTTPPIITDVQVSGITDKLAVVSWSTNEPADSVVEYGTTVNYGISAFDKVFVLGHTVTLTELQPSTTYHFRAASKDASGNGPTYSGDYSFKTPATPDITPPVISNVKVSGITDRLAVVSWETDEPGDSAVEYGASTSYGSSIADGKYLLQHEMTVSGLNSSTVIHFRVKSRDTTGNGPAVSADYTFTTLAQPDKTPPQILNSRVEGVTESAATVLWETDEVADSFVEYGPNASYGQSTADRAMTLRHSMQLQGLVSDKTYHCRAISADSSSNTAKGVDLTFKTAKRPAEPDTTPPVVNDVNVSGISDTRAVVMWTTDELANSEVEYGKTDSYGLRASDGTYTVFHSIVLNSLNPSTSYHLRVKSSDTSGNGPSVSVDVRFTTAATPDTSPPRISGIKVTNVTKNGATITWSTDEPSTSVVDYGNDTRYGKRLASQVNVLQHGVVLTGLAQNTVYHFRVSSSDPSGNSASPSVDQTFTTLSTDVAGTSGGLDLVTLLWIIVAIALIVCLVGFYLMYRNMKRREAEAGAIEPGAYYGETPQDDEMVETLQMESVSGEQVEMPAPEPPAPLAAGEAETEAPVSTATPIRHIRCPKCRARVPIYQEGPHRLTCPHCGRIGFYKPKAVGHAPRPSPPPVPPPVPPPIPEPEHLAPAEDVPPVRLIRCSNCGSEVPIYTSVYPVRITCPSCGRSGIFRGPRA